MPGTKRAGWWRRLPLSGEGGDLAEINHTFVDPSLRGQGVAGQLVQAAAEALKEENCKIYPTCSYARRWFEEHPEYGELLE